MSFFTGTLVASPLVIGSQTDGYGTHHSVLGIGGYMEVDTISQRDSIPINSINGLYSDGISSGRRRLGMLVKVNQLDKIFQLSIPYGTWTALTNTQKVNALGNNLNWKEFKVGDGERIEKEITQTAHGFNVGDAVIYIFGTGYVKAISDGSQNNEVIGFVRTVSDANTFIVTYAGYIDINFNLYGLVGGTLYYVSNTVAGQIIPVEPTTIGHISRPLLLTLGNNQGLVLQYRPRIIEEEPIRFAENGLTKIGNTVSLGGNLIQNTILSGNSEFTLISGDLSLVFFNGEITSLNGRGIEYAADYSANYSLRSLIDKAYVDTLTLGLRPKESVTVATTSNLASFTGAMTIDNISLVDGDRVLVKDQNDLTENGIYTFSANTLTRSLDFNGIAPDGIVEVGAFVVVLTGDTNAFTGWILSSNITGSTVNVGVDDINWNLFNKILNISEGDGIRITNTSSSQIIEVKLAPNSSLSFNVNDELRVDSSIAGLGLSYNTGVLNVRTSNATPVGTEILVKINTGGTNQLYIDSEDIPFPPQFSGITSANNGLTINGQNIQLGGELTGNTRIFAATYDFELDVDEINLTSNNTNLYSNILNLSGNSEINLQTEDFYLEYKKGTTGSTGVVISSAISGRRWLEYLNDYSNNFSNRSIPDVGWVNAQILVLNNVVNTFQSQLNTLSAQTLYISAVTGSFLTSLFNLNNAVSAITNNIIFISGITDSLNINLNNLSGVTNNLINDISFLSGQSDNLFAHIQYISGITDNVINNITYISGVTDSIISDILFISGVTNNIFNDISFISGETVLNSNNITFISGVTDILNNNIAFISGITNNIINDITYLSGVTNTIFNDISFLSGETVLNSNNITFISGITDILINNINYLSGVTNSIFNDISFLSGETILNSNNIIYISGVTDNIINDITFISGITDNIINDIQFLGSLSGITMMSITGATNVGIGNDVYVNTVNRNLNLRRIIGSGVTSVTTSGNTIIISSLSAATPSIFYTGATPSTITVGGLSVGSTLTGNTLSQLLEKILVPYLLPAFTSFNIGQSTPIEVGEPLSGNRTFTWNISNSGNVQPNSINIRDVTSNLLIATLLPNNGSASANIGTITNTSPITRQWRGEGTNTQTTTFQSSPTTVNSIYPYFWGIVPSGGASAGDNRPIANQSLINGGNKVVLNSNGTININFNSTSDDYIWFAIPETSTTKTVWFVTALNNGTIGGSVSPGGNLFPAHTIISVNSPTALWNGINYKVFISNYQTAVVANMELRNS